jgi:hypothetical protein
MTKVSYEAFATISLNNCIVIYSLEQAIFTFLILIHAIDIFYPYCKHFVFCATLNLTASTDQCNKKEIKTEPKQTAKYLPLLKGKRVAIMATKQVSLANTSCYTVLKLGKILKVFGLNMAVVMPCRSKSS